MALYRDGKLVKENKSTSYTPGQKGQYKEDRFNYEQREKDRNNNSSSNSGGVGNFVKDFFDKGKPENVITGDDFASDLKKASKYLYTQHPYAKELMAKYNLDNQDIIDLRIGMTQRGFGDKIRGVYDTKVKPGLMQSNSTYGTDYAMQFFKEGMKPSDMVNPEFNAFQQKLSEMPFLKGVNALFGSPKGQRGLFDGRARGLEGDELQDYAAAIANNPNLYEQMMATPRMQDYDFNEFIYGVRRDLPAEGRGIESLPAAEPGFDFITDNPYLN
jgi:hypothetical protein|tara:strand:+ start:164 stop:979 length:816 start_codon:yes stop_codon:yes gene_type:complete